MKRPVSWHKECLANATASNAYQKKQIEQMQADYDRFQRELIAYDAQIIRAEEMGIAEFDRDKFGNKK